MFVHHSPPDSPGAGVIAATITIIATGTRVATIGAVNPAIDWATSTRSGAPSRPASPIAATTASAYSGNPARSSSHGRSTAIERCPAAASSGSTRCQYQESDAAPGRSTNVAMETDDAGARSSSAPARSAATGRSAPVRGPSDLLR